MNHRTETLYDAARRECAYALFEMPEDLQLSKGAVLELMVQAIEHAEQTGWPLSDDRVRVSVLRQQLEKAIAGLRAQGWQGGR